MLFARYPVLLGAICACVGSQAAASPTSRYLPQGAPETGGMRHLCLIYHGSKARVPWTADAIMPYVAHVDEAGKPTDWLFDSFLFLEFATDSGVQLHSPGRPLPTVADWQWLADAWFRPRTGLAGLERAVERAGRALGDRTHKVNVVITLPVPLREGKAFGPLPGETAPLDLSVEANRQRALAWYIDEVLRQWGAGRYRHLNLAGFYWTAESVGGPDAAIARWTSDYLHAKGLRHYWIPYLGASGVNDWRKAGFDAMMLQPNYFFNDPPDVKRFATVARIAQMTRSGVEIEFDSRALSSDDYRDRFYAYLDAGVKYDWMKGALLGYYEGGRAVMDFATSPGTGRELYEALYRFVKGTYEPRGKTPLPEAKVVTRDNRGNLALAANGARITGCVRDPKLPELAPEKIIDGDISNYGGMNGFGYFAWPGSFTIELPRVSTVARTQMMLFEIDGRTFRYRVETSLDGITWEPAADKSEGEWGGWQVDTFAPRKAKYVRMTGLHNSVNNLFQVVEFEVYADHG
jgi:hypothetical protein